MKLLIAMAFLLSLTDAQAGLCKDGNETLVSYPDNQYFCYLSRPIPTTELDDSQNLWEQTTKSLDELHKRLNENKYKGSYNDLTKELIQLYGNLDYAAKASGHNFTGLGRSFFETTILAVQGKKGPNAVNVKWLKMKDANNALTQSASHLRLQTRETSCEADYQKRIRKLAKKSVFGPTITGALTGTSATLASGLYAMSLGPEFPLWLANLVGREVYKLPFATIAPVAGWIGLGVGVATLVGYEGIILAKIIRMAQALDVIRQAQKGHVKKSFASKLGGIAKVTVRGWDPKKKEAILAQTITTLDHQGMQGVARGVLEAGPFEEGVQVCSIDLPHKKDLINFINMNPEYLLAQLQPPSVKDLLANGATKTEIKIEGCKVSGGFVPGANILSMRYSSVGIKEEGVKRTNSSEVWNQPISLSSNQGKLPKDLVEEFKNCLVPSRDGNIGKNISMKIVSNLSNDPGSRSIILEDVMMSKKDKRKEDGLFMRFMAMTVREESRNSYLETEKDIVLGTKIKIVQPGSEPDSAWETCVAGDYRMRPEVGDEVVVAHRRAIREQSEANMARRTFAGKKLFWITHFVRPDLQKWKRIVTNVDINQNGQEDKSVSYEECVPEEFQFPVLLPAPTGNLMEEVVFRPVRGEIK
ncbi:MAG: hypothetical protein HYV97_03210 [Bdellovibrio sp.]|nr:hypothetical protein [Bdellovibrio sp.]